MKLRSKCTFAVACLSSVIAHAQLVQIDYPGIPFGTQVNGISGNIIAGSYSDGTTGHGFTYNIGNGTYASFDDPLASPNFSGATRFLGIDGGNIVGDYVDSNAFIHGLLYNGSTYTTLDAPQSNNRTIATGISGGNIVGWYDDNNGVGHGFIYNNGSYTILDDPAAVMLTLPRAISGDIVVGDYSTDASHTFNFVYNITTSTYSSMPLLGSAVVDPLGISGGNIVGDFVSGTNHTSGFLYDGDNYTPYNVGANSTSLVGLSGNYFVGDYLDSNGQNHGFLTTQIPEPATWALFSGGFAMALAAFRKLRRQ